MSDETPNVRIRVHDPDCEHCAELRARLGPEGCAAVGEMLAEFMSALDPSGSVWKAVPTP